MSFYFDDIEQKAGDGVYSPLFEDPVETVPTLGSLFDHPRSLEDMDEAQEMRGDVFSTSDARAFFRSILLGELELGSVYGLSSSWFSRVSGMLRRSVTQVQNAGVVPPNTYVEIPTMIRSMQYSSNSAEYHYLIPDQDNAVAELMSCLMAAVDAVNRANPSLTHFALFWRREGQNPNMSAVNSHSQSVTFVREAKASSFVDARLPQGFRSNFWDIREGVGSSMIQVVIEAVLQFIMERLVILEYYSDRNHPSVYHRIHQIHFVFYNTNLNLDSPIGAPSLFEYRTSEFLSSFTSSYVVDNQRCVDFCLASQLTRSTNSYYAFRKAVFHMMDSPIKPPRLGSETLTSGEVQALVNAMKRQDVKSVADVVRMCMGANLEGPLSLRFLSKLPLFLDGQKLNLRIVVFDCSWNMMYYAHTKQPHDRAPKIILFLVVQNAHAFMFKDNRLAYAQFRRCLSLFNCFYQLVQIYGMLKSVHIKDFQNIEKPTTKSFEEALIKCFTVTHDSELHCLEMVKHKLPDIRAIEKYLCSTHPEVKGFGELSVSSEYHYFLGEEHYVWEDIKRQVGFYGLDRKLVDRVISHLEANRTSCVSRRRKNKRMRKGNRANPLAPGVKSHYFINPSVPLDLKASPKYLPPEQNCLAWDLECYSLEDQKFRVYNVTWQYRDEKGNETLRRGDLDEETDEFNRHLLLEEVHKWLNISKREGLDSLYCYSYNGARFDNVEILNTLLTTYGCKTFGPMPISEYLFNNGRIISFRFGPLVFRDLCLITMSSLRSAAQSFGISMEKGYFPHKYLQCLQSNKQFVDRLYSLPKLRDIESFIMFWDDVVDSDILQKRYWGDTNYDEVLAKYSCVYRDWYEPNQDSPFDVFGQMSTYAMKDTMVTYQLMVKFAHYLEQEGVDLRRTLTVGSLAIKMWQMLLPRPVTKLREPLAKIWAESIQGGFSGPLGPLEYYCPKDSAERIYKVDITSLYPASSKALPFFPKNIFHGFPKAVSPDSWQTLTDIQFQTLYGTTNLHSETPFEGRYGCVHIEYDQSHLAWPLFLTHLRAKEVSTLTYCMRGRGWYCVPMVRLAIRLGVKCTFLSMVYVSRKWNPFTRYVKKYEKMKNTADAQRKTLLREHPSEDGRPTHIQDKIDACMFQRTFAKLMSNSLWGRLDMNIENSNVVLTRDFNDVIGITSNTLSFKERTWRRIELDHQSRAVYEIKYTPKSYEERIKGSSVAPYLASYMLCYSKIIMFLNFSRLVQLGGRLLYTDTDSIRVAMTESQFNKYAKEFIPKKKAYGYMVLEGIDRGFKSCGPKKHMGINDEYMEWKANGIRSPENMQTDMNESFYQAIRLLKTVQVKMFSIRRFGNGSFSNFHTSDDDGFKILRMLMYKGLYVPSPILKCSNPKIVDSRYHVCQCGQLHTFDASKGRWYQSGFMRFWESEDEFKDTVTAPSLINYDRESKCLRGVYFESYQERNPEDIQKGRHLGKTMVEHKLSMKLDSKYRQVVLQRAYLKSRFKWYAESLASAMWGVVKKTDKFLAASSLELMVNIVGSLNMSLDELCVHLFFTDVQSLLLNGNDGLIQFLPDAHIYLSKMVAQELMLRRQMFIQKNDLSQSVTD